MHQVSFHTLQIGYKVFGHINAKSIGIEICKIPKYGSYFILHTPIYSIENISSYKPQTPCTNLY